MKKLGLLFFLSVIFLFVKGQKNYEGIVTDPATGEGISEVIIQSSNSGFSSFSDSVGFFSILLNTEKPSQDELTVSYYSENHSLHWDLSERVLFELFSIDGRLIFSSQGDKKGSLKLPPLKNGYYLLVLSSIQQQAKYFFVSEGENVYLAPREGFAIPYDSSLIFKKQDYYSREVSLLGQNLRQVNLLKKHYDDLDYFSELVSYDAFNMLQSSPPITNFGEVQSVKALYDFVQDKIYYINVNKYPGHYSFAKEVLHYPYGSMNFMYSQYMENPNRFSYLITINYYVNIDKYVFEFGPYDEIQCDGILQTYQKLLETSYFKDKLYFYPSNMAWKDCVEVSMITAEELFLGQNYQALNLEENYGYLRKVEMEQLSSSYLGRHDVVLLNGIPNDLSVVSGIITTEYQTPLSHINILSHSRQTPNMALIDAWTNPQLDSLMGELVYLKVESNSFTIRKASLEEATEFWLAREPHIPITLELDTETSGLVELENEDIFSVDKIGGKAANFAELVNLGTIPLPENSFAIPFYYYQQHIENYGIDTIIDDMLGEEEFYENIEYRETRLQELRNLILESPLDIDFLNMVKTRINNFEEFSSFRFRSSTNAEDLENFSGAGLYDSYSAKKNHPTKTVENAIKKVWASLWNLRAFDEREYFMINQNFIAMGLLVHRSFPDEDANGVIVTKNLYNVNSAYTFNVQYKEYSIVYPEPGILHDQILVYTFNFDTLDYTIQYLSHSNVPELEGQTVLTNQELYEIADYCTIIKTYYYDNIDNNCNCEFKDFAIDIEFKVDSMIEERKIYLKQARIYISN